MTVEKFSHHRVRQCCVPASRRGRTAWAIGRAMLALCLVLLAAGAALPGTAHAQDLGTPAPVETTPASEPTVVPTEPPPTIEPTEEPTVESGPAEAPAAPEDTEPSTEPADQPGPSDETGGDEDAGEPGEVEFELAPDTSGTPAPTGETPVATVESVAPFAPVLECLPHERTEIATAGEGHWALLACSIAWETADIEAIHLVARPLVADWWVSLVDENDPESTEIPLTARLEAGDSDLDLPDTAFTSGAGSSVSASFLLGAQLGCSATLSTIVELAITAQSNLDDNGVAGYEETVTDEIELFGQSAPAPDLHDLALTFTSVSNSLESWVSTGSFTLAYSGAPTRCGWLVSLTFADFTAGNYRIPASHLIATAVSGIEGALVTSDQGVVTIMIADGFTPRSANGVLHISLELTLGSYLPTGNYQTVVTVNASAMP